MASVDQCNNPCHNPPGPCPGVTSPSMLRVLGLTPMSSCLRLACLPDIAAGWERCCLLLSPPAVQRTAAEGSWALCGGQQSIRCAPGARCSWLVPTAHAQRAQKDGGWRGRAGNPQDSCVLGLEGIGTDRGGLCGRLGSTSAATSAPAGSNSSFQTVGLAAGFYACAC